MTIAAPVGSRTVPCPYCGVPSGERCVVQGGRYGVDYPMPPYARRPHTARMKLALALFGTSEAAVEAVAGWAADWPGAWQ
jgi:hypothetical protein